MQKARSVNKKQYSCYATILILYACLQQSSATVVSSSELKKCVRDGSNFSISCYRKKASETSLACQDMLTMTFAINGGNNIGTEALEFKMSCVGSTICPCPCDYASDRTCNCRDVDQTLQIEILKSPLVAAYPIKYLKSFNYNPTEVVVPSKDCKDGDKEKSPTCGWYTEGGKQVPNSQGFCCECNSDQKWDDTFGASKDTTRANLKCGYFDGSWYKFWEGDPKSAHCLKFDSLWYEGFEVESPYLSFDIDIKLNFKDSTNKSYTEVLRIGPSEPHKMNKDKTVEAKLLGDLSAYTQLSDLSNKILVVPFNKGKTPEQALTTNQNQWMLIDKTMISMDGSECDKVGTSFTAFRFQTNRCDRPAGTCLSNSIKKIYETDSERSRTGKTPLYLLSRYGRAANISYDKSYGTSLALPVNQIRNSLVQLSLKADDLRYIQNSSPGVILDAKLCKFNNVTCGYFEALTERGYLNVKVQNIGYVDSEFTITASNCNWEVMEMPAQKVSIAALDIATLPPFFVYVKSPNATSNIFCWINLYSSQGIQLDLKKVTFSLNSTVLEDKFVNMDLPKSEFVNEKKETKEEKCARKCPNIFNFWCLIWNMCWSRMGRAMLYIVLFCIGGSILFVAIKKGLIVKTLHWCVSGCGASGIKTIKKSRKSKKKKIQKKGEEVKRKKQRKKEKSNSSNSSGSSSNSNSCLKERKKKIRKSSKKKKKTTEKRNLPYISTEAKLPVIKEEVAVINWDYLDVSLYSDLSFLREPGSHACLAGKIQRFTLSADLPPSIVFIIPMERNRQKYIYDKESSTYVKLEIANIFDHKIASINLDNKSLQAYVTYVPRGQCLN